MGLLSTSQEVLEPLARPGGLRLGDVPASPAEQPRRAVPVGVVQLGDQPPLLRRLGHRLRLRVQLGEGRLGRRLGRQLLRPLPEWQ